LLTARLAVMAAEATAAAAEATSAADWTATTDAAMLLGEDATVAWSVTYPLK
jgi:hypothetical protein